MTLSWLTFFPSPARGVWHLGPVPIRAYALCIIVGIIVALLIGDRRWRARGGEPGVIYDIALWAVPFGLIGGRLYHLMTDWRTYFGEGGIGWEATPRIWDGGLGIWGAVALGGVGAWIGCRRHEIPLPAFGDAVAPGIVLAQAIGRLGNYFNQELYGRETTLPWGLEIFWREDTAGVRDPHLLDGVSTGELYKIVQPTFLYELLWNLVVFIVLIYADRRFRLGHGRLFALYVAGYCIGRFGIELLRDDAATQIAGIRVNLFTSTFVFIGAVVYILLAPKGREDPETIRRAWQSDEPDETPAPLEHESAAEKELVGVGAAANSVGSVVRAPKGLTGEADLSDLEAEEDTDDVAVGEDADQESADGIDGADETELGEDDDVEAEADDAEAEADDVEAEADDDADKDGDAEVEVQVDADEDRDEVHSDDGTEADDPAEENDAEENDAEDVEDAGEKVVEAADETPEPEPEPQEPEPEPTVDVDDEQAEQDAIPAEQDTAEAGEPEPESDAAGPADAETIDASEDDSDADIEAEPDDTDDADPH